MTDFLANFRTRQLLCQTLASLSQREEVAIETHNYVELIDVLERKDRVLGKLTEGQSLVDHWRNTRDSLPTTVREECEQLLHDCETTLLQEQTRTQHATERMNEQRRATIDSIRRTTSGEQAHQQYQSGTQAAGSSTRLDLVR